MLEPSVELVEVGKWEIACHFGLIVLQVVIGWSCHGMSQESKCSATFSTSRFKPIDERRVWVGEVSVDLGAIHVSPLLAGSLPSLFGASFRAMTMLSLAIFAMICANYSLGMESRI